jgi:hypothetical protein
MRLTTLKENQARLVTTNLFTGTPSLQIPMNRCSAVFPRA